MPAGYSGTPLARKLGIKAGHRVAVLDGPEGFRDLLTDLPEGVELGRGVDDKADLIIGFFTSAAELDTRLPHLGRAIHPERVLWLAWPKKSSGVETDLTGDVVRATVLRSSHLVDVKVCAISEVWSGLKVVWRSEHRHG